MSHVRTRTAGIVPYPVGQWVLGGLLGGAGAKGGQVGRREPVSPLPSPGLPNRVALPALSPKFPGDSIRRGQRAWPGWGRGTWAAARAPQGRWPSASLPCRYHHTTPVIGLFGLREALAVIAEEVRGREALAAAGRAGAEPGRHTRCWAWTSCTTGHLVKPARAARCAEDSAEGREARSAAVVTSDTTPGFSHRGTFLQPLPVPRRGAAAWQGRLVWPGNVHTGRRTGHTARSKAHVHRPGLPKRPLRPPAQGPQTDQGWSDLHSRLRCWAQPPLSAHKAGTPGPSGSHVTGTWAGP